MDIIPGTSKPVISPLAHLIQDGLALPNAWPIKLKDSPDWGSIRKFVPGLGSIWAIHRLRCPNWFGQSSSMTGEVGENKTRLSRWINFQPFWC